MAVPTGVTWSRDDHTGAKHDLLRRYLNALLPIQLQHKQRVTYVEGFSGPGVYTGGEPGSPIVALECFTTHSRFFAPPFNRTADIVLIEEQQPRTQRLRQELATAQQRLTVPAGVTVHDPITGDCVDVLSNKLDELKVWGQPLFVFLDSFGGPDIPLDLVTRIAQSRYSEVLLTFAPNFLVRHGENVAHTAKGDIAFGGTHWQGVFKQAPQDKFGYLVEAYKTSLNNGGYPHTLAFVMNDEGGRQVVLLFGTTHPIGIEKMKEAMWGVAPIHGVRYTDPADPNQTMLDIAVEPDLSPLSTILLRKLNDGPTTLEDLRTYTNEHTVYRKPHARTVALKLIREGSVGKSNDTALRSDSVLTLADAGRRQLIHHEATLL